jgi:hypothetical protein
VLSGFAGIAVLEKSAAFIFSFYPEGGNSYVPPKQWHLPTMPHWLTFQNLKSAKSACYIVNVEWTSLEPVNNLVKVWTKHVFILSREQADTPKHQFEQFQVQVTAFHIASHLLHPF